MKRFTNSDIYLDQINVGNAISNKIHKVLSDPRSRQLINGDIIRFAQDMATRSKAYKDPSTIQLVQAIQNRELELVCIPPENKIPKYIPFIAYKAGGTPRVVVNMTDIVTSSYDEDVDATSYSVDIRDLYAACFPAYCQLRLFDDNTVLPPNVSFYSAVLWARLFCKPLERAIALGTNSEKYQAFMYFAVKFFLSYYLELPKQVVEDMGDRYIKSYAGIKSQYVISIEDSIRVKDIKINEGFVTFCATLLNDDITGVRGIKKDSTNHLMDVTYYFRQYAELYGASSVMALCSFPYFFYMLVAANEASGTLRKASIDNTLKNDQKIYNEVIISIKQQLR